MANWLADHRVPGPGYEDCTRTLIPASSRSLVAIGAAIAWFMYSRNGRRAGCPRAATLLTLARCNAARQRGFNETVFMRPGQWLCRFWLVWFDNRVVDGVVNGTAATIGGLSVASGAGRTGLRPVPALSMLGGAALVAVALVLVRL